MQFCGREVTFVTMFIYFVPIICSVATANLQNDPAANQLPIFKESRKGLPRTLTTNTGAPVEYRETSTLNSNLLDNEYAMDELLGLVHERIPERVVHASGTGAFGYFETTHDISHICKAKLFSEVGKKTPVAVRFSLTTSSRGVRDTNRELRGFAVKFYTEEGNLDFLAINSPVFAIRDPLLFVSLVHSLKRNPATNLPDSNAVLDFMTRHPEGILTFMYLFSAYGMPVTYRHMPGFVVHTYQVYNEDGVSSYVKFHFVPVLGTKNLNATEELRLAAGDPDYYAKDLYNAIANGECARWYVKVQILSEKDRKNAKQDIFDVTKDLPLDKYPLHSVGILTLDTNPINYFAEMEQIAFSPGNMVPGILGSPDTFFQGRRMAYKEGAIHRLGANFKKIPVNCPMQVNNYIRDGVPPVNDNGRNGPNYFANSFDGPIPLKDEKRPELIKITEKVSIDFKQAGEFYTDTLNPDEQSGLIDNFTIFICPAQEFMKKRVVKMLKKINSDLGNRVAKSLSTKCPNMR